MIQIQLPTGFKDMVYLGEGYYHYTDSSGIVEKETYELIPDENNIIILDVSRKGNIKNETAIYYLKDDLKDRATFVFQVEFPLQK